MAAASAFVDWTNLAVQRHWYAIRRELEHEIQSATDQVRREYDVSIRLTSATITSDGGRGALRVPVSAIWRHDIEQTIALILVTEPEENEPRMAAIAHGIDDLLHRWVEREIAIRAAPVFLYPEAEVRWPDFDSAQSKTATAPTPAAAPDAVAPQPGAAPGSA